MTRLPRKRLLPRRLSDQPAIRSGSKKSNYAESFKPEFSLRELSEGETVDGAAIDALVRKIPLREAFFYSETFHQRAQSNDADDPWRLLELVFGLHFWPENKEDPLGPLNNLSPKNVALLRAIFVESQDAEIRSRLGDVLWLFTADLHAMEIAVDAYLESGLRLEDPAHWGHAIRRYQRAAELALDLRRKPSLRRRVSEFMFDRVRFYEGKDLYYFTAQALEILVLLRADNPLELSGHAVIAAERARANGDSRRARACYTAAEKFSRSAKDEMGILSARTAIAETWVEEAERLDAVGDFLTVRYVRKRAILAYRRLGNETRAAELRVRLTDAKRLSRKETGSLRNRPKLS